jgi:hypothetical protein
MKKARPHDKRPTVKKPVHIIRKKPVTHNRKDMRIVEKGIHEKDLGEKAKTGAELLKAKAQVSQVAPGVGMTLKIRDAALAERFKGGEEVDVTVTAPPAPTMETEPPPA